jgi:hypothetical protein
VKCAAQLEVQVAVGLEGEFVRIESQAAEMGEDTLPGDGNTHAVEDGKSCTAERMATQSCKYRDMEAGRELMRESVEKSGGDSYLSP